MNQQHDDDEGAGRQTTLRITVARSGGVAGVRPTWSITASEEPEVDSWLSLVESCPWPGDDASDTPGEADRFVYTIRVVIDPAQHPAEERDATVPERSLAGPWAELVDRVKDASPRRAP
ncbi:protealysin inhibitor emfourin [Herbiconiux sp. KACC 21604]|uniref:protealysin inhibitor emfourin n=1 Tax=unclassified Herbiconiux TaxID=2618217 RepID=UPI0020A4DC07|nr:protealysin inhibitor emfourin [Herbiconiux sp. SALV-R1]WPO88154.1 protealysin inhibitor emfourin [Herbiconiux sp. KACC 21604]